MKSKAIRESARGQNCTVNIVGVCSDDPETTVFAHFPDESGGMGLKSSDLSGAYSCSACHDAIDMRVRSEEFIVNAEFYMRRAMIRTWRRLVGLGIVKVKGWSPK